MVILIVVVFGGIFVIGIIAAIAIPGLLRARMSGNEAAALGSVQTMVSAEVAWASGHGGRFAQPACLGEPASCGDTQTPGMLTAEIAALQPRSGYDFGFVLRPGSDEAATDDGAAATATGGTPGVSPPDAPTDAEVRAQLEQFSTPDTGAATPQRRAAQPARAVRPRRLRLLGLAVESRASRGARRFCVDETGVVREYDLDAAWTAPSDDQPRCPDTGRPLQ